MVVNMSVSGGTVSGVQMALNVLVQMALNVLVLLQMALWDSDGTESLCV